MTIPNELTLNKPIAIVRHGSYEQPKDVPSAHLPHGLDAAGIEHARLAADSIVEYAQKHECNIHPVVHCSVLLRAWESASILATRLAELLNQEFVVTETKQLCERALGSAANMTLSQIEAAIERDPRFEALPQGWKRNLDFCLPWPGAESLRDAGKRVADYIYRQAYSEKRDETEAGGDREISSCERSETAKLQIFVGHGGAFRSAAVCSGALTEEDFQKFSMYHGQAIFMDVGADGQWRHRAGKWKIRSPGQVSPTPNQVRADLD